MSFALLLFRSRAYQPGVWVLLCDQTYKSFLSSLVMVEKPFMYLFRIVKKIDTHRERVAAQKRNRKEDEGGKNEVSTSPFLLFSAAVRV